MLLRDFMRVELLSDSDMAERIGGISAETVRKLRFRVRGTSMRVAARIEAISGGKVRSPDLLPVSRRGAPSPARETRSR